MNTGILYLSRARRRFPKATLMCIVLLAIVFGYLCRPRSSLPPLLPLFFSNSQSIDFCHQIIFKHTRRYPNGFRLTLHLFDLSENNYFDFKRIVRKERGEEKRGEGEEKEEWRGKGSKISQKWFFNASFYMNAHTFE